MTKDSNQEKIKLPCELRKKVKHFHESRDEWKQRNAEKRKQIQVLMTKNLRLEIRLENIMKDIGSLEKTLNQTLERLYLAEEEGKRKDGEIEILKKNSSYNHTRN
jgi:response regulator RpfG family c-di-GMP phosphodiesterase